MSESKQICLPILPLRDIVIFPGMVTPLFVSRETSLKALKRALNKEKRVILVTQHDPDEELPDRDSLYDIGVIATILQSIELPDGTLKVLVEGTQRFALSTLHKSKGFYTASGEIIVEQKKYDKAVVKSLRRQVEQQFENLARLVPRFPPEILSTLSSLKDHGHFVDAVAAHLTSPLEMRQKILECLCFVQRFETLLSVLFHELDLVEVDKKIQGRFKDQIEKSQRQYYLSEKMKAIQGELEDLGDGVALDELEALAEQIQQAGMPSEALEKAEAELAKLKVMPSVSAEATVCRNYLESLIDFPWQSMTQINQDIVEAEKVLEADHFGLEKVKERILEYLAVEQRVEKLKGPILCLVGPPGVGKTSLGQSIANATGRTFVRMSLGGVRDEAEIRGHRRTYVGAMPGKIVQKLIKAKVKNPLFMLDEIDKMAMDFRGDPASALLEVLDPEQNDTFNDHFLEVDCDLSDVMFIATSNSLDIPHALLDRMEIIRLSGYTENEKINIAKRYLIPRQIKKNGLKKSEIKITDSAIKEMIRYYNREAGVRSLERDIAKICRKVVRAILIKNNKKTYQIGPKVLEQYLGVKRYRYGLTDKKNRIGQVTGLAWTEVGGELLSIEAQVLPGKDAQVIRTGCLGDVMMESITAAMTVVRSRSDSLGIDLEVFQKNDFHIHVPEGATPKDGPSAGIGMVTALLSVLTDTPVRADVAMTGEITLRGEVLPIGGLKEKLLAALGGGIREVIIPWENERDLKEIPKEVTNGLIIHPVKWIDEVIHVALTSHPMPSKKRVKKASLASSKEVKKRGGSRRAQ